MTTCLRSRSLLVTVAAAALASCAAPAPPKPAAPAVPPQQQVVIESGSYVGPKPTDDLDSVGTRGLRRHRPRQDDGSSDDLDDEVGGGSSRPRAGGEHIRPVPVGTVSATPLDAPVASDGGGIDAFDPAAARPPRVERAAAGKKRASPPEVDVGLSKAMSGG